MNEDGEGGDIMESNGEESYDHVEILQPTTPRVGILRKQTSKGKCVRFRENIADYVEPIPTNIINDEEYANVLESYEQLCMKLRVRPCRKLMDQLEGLQDSTLKLDTIDLKGTRLEAAHCEALEAVLRVLRAQTLNIEQTQLDDDGAISLFEMIEYYEPITRLIVANNVRLGVRAWLALARLLKRFHRLEYLDVRRTSLDESTMPLLCRVLKLNCPLRVLHLEDNHLSGILTRNLVWGLRTNTLLQDLFLGHNRLTPEDAKLIGSLLITNHTIRLLDLRNNRLQDTGIIFLASALEEQHAGLQLITVWSNQITASSMPALSRALAFHTTLEGVNLGSNAIGNKGIECLKEGLLSSRSIARLVMASCTITNEGAVVMAEIIGDHTTLIHIDLRENNITLAGVLALKCAYAINNKLLRLHLDVMKKTNHDPLMEQLLTDIELYSVRNLELHKHTDSALAEKLQKNIIAGGANMTVEQVKERRLQEQVDYQLALKLQQEETVAAKKSINSPGQKLDRPLPIISPVMASPPDPTKTFGFFSGHYMKLKQRWDESVSLYLNKSDVSLAASPGNDLTSCKFYDKTGADSNDDDDQFEDAVEDQADEEPSLIISSLRDSVRLTHKHQKPSVDALFPELGDSGDMDISLSNDVMPDMLRDPPSDLPLTLPLNTVDFSPAPNSLTPSNFDEVWFTGPESNYSTRHTIPSDSGERSTPSTLGSPDWSDDVAYSSSSTTDSKYSSSSTADSKYSNYTGSSTGYSTTDSGTTLSTDFSSSSTGFNSNTTFSSETFSDDSSLQNSGDSKLAGRAPHSSDISSDEHQAEIVT